MLKNSKGITLIALVITLIVILIIATIAINAGTGSIDNTDFNNTKSQFQTMQDYANSWYEEKISGYGEEISSKADTEILAKMKEDLSIDDFTTEGYKYFSADYIKNTLKIDGIDSDFLINMSNATVLLFGGIEYEGKTYYLAKDFGIETVDYQFNKDVSFDTTTKIIENKGYIIVYNIKFSENISKYDVQYKKYGENDWKTVKVNNKKTYKYSNDEGKTITDNNAWYISSPVSIDDIEGKVYVKIVTKSAEVASEPKEVNIKWVESIQFDTKIESDKVIAYNIKFFYKDSQEVKLSTYDVKYKNDGESTWREMEKSESKEEYYLTVEDTDRAKSATYGYDDLPYIDETKGYDINIYIKVFTKLSTSCSEEQKIYKKPEYKFIGKEITTSLIEEYKQNGNVLKLRDVSWKDGSDENVVINVPVGFTISGEDGDCRKGEELNATKFKAYLHNVLIDSGIVITATNEKSEFVWVPVTNIGKMAKTGGDRL